MTRKVKEKSDERVPRVGNSKNKNRSKDTRDDEEESRSYTTRTRKGIWNCLGIHLNLNLDLFNFI